MLHEIGGRSPWRSALAAVGITVGASIGLRYVDLPASPDALPSELTEVLGQKATQIAGFYSYDLGGFIDHESLWRIDASPKVISLVIGALCLTATDTVPRQFWAMPPHYWPRAKPVAAGAYRTAGFFGDRRGPDGAQYFLLYDETRERAFIWFKDNF